MNMIADVPKTTNQPSLPQMETYDARDIILNGTQACIVLDEQIYYLRITRAGKLILTK